VARKVERKIMETRRYTTHNYKYGSLVAPSFPKDIRLTPQQLEEKREKGIRHSCDRKCIRGHKCKEKVFFFT